MITFMVVSVHIRTVGCQGEPAFLFMPHPAKTNRETILLAAVKDLAHGGIRDLSLRNLAASLDLAPNAIYRHFADRPALEAALADECARRLELALRKAVARRVPAAAIRAMAAAYLRFARENRHLYEVMMSFHRPEHAAACRQSLWTFTTGQVRRLADAERAEQATVALWALLHGVAVLAAAQVLGEDAPTGGLDFGLDAWLRAVSGPEERTCATRITGAEKS